MNCRLLLLAMTLSCITLPLQGYAGSCDAYSRDKAEYFAEKAGKKMISEYGGGQDKRVKMTRCEYNAYSETYKLKIEVYWNGSIFRDNNYNVDGVLKLNSDGTDAKFSQTYANQNVKDLVFYRNFAIGTVVLGALIAESNSSTSE